MAQETINQTTEQPVDEAEKSIDEETRVDEFAIGQFKAMGHKTLLPDMTVRLYKEFKLRKDRLFPSRLTPEGFAFVELMADIFDGRFTPNQAAKTEQ